MRKLRKLKSLMKMTTLLISQSYKEATSKFFPSLKRFTKDLSKKKMNLAYNRRSKRKAILIESRENSRMRLT